MAFAFSKNSVARISDVVKYVETFNRRRPLPRARGPVDSGIGGILVVLNADLPAASGTTWGSIAATVWTFDGTSTSSSAQTITVYNASSHLIPVGSTCICLGINGYPVVVFLDCGP